MTDIPKILQLRDHLSISETTIGLILSGKQTTTGFNPDFFSGDYSKVLRDLQAGKKLEDLIVKYGSTLIQTAIHAGKSVNGLGTELDWRDVIATSYRHETIADALETAKKQLERGDSDKFSETLRRINATYTNSQRLRSVRASEISDEYTPMMKSGSNAIDTHIGGLPTVGVFLLGAKTYTGKTTVAISMVANFLNEYPEKEVLFVSLEDMNEGWKHRAKTILGNRSKEFWDRVIVMEFAKSMNEIIEEAARYENIGMIVVDFIDYMAPETDLSAFEEIYRTASTGSKSLAAQSKHRSMPIILLAQFGKTLYKGGVPTTSAVKYTGDQYAYHICMLYNAEGDYYSDDEENAYVLPAQEGYAYLVYWKVKNARPHGKDFPGAIKVPWDAKFGYALDNDGEWYSLASETKRQVQKKRGK